MMTQEMMMLGDQGRTNKQRGHQGKGKASNIIKFLTLFSIELLNNTENLGKYNTENLRKSRALTVKEELN